MSYAFGITCPEGWSLDASGNCHSDSATTCPNGFTQRVPGECWPSTPSACWDLMREFYFPEQPDRCKTKCPEGTEADQNHVCHRIAGTMWTPTVIGMIVFGAVGIAAVAIAR